MYKWDAQRYHKNSSHQKRWARGLLRQAVFKGNENVLEVGCGDGQITAAISRSVPYGSVLGVDSSGQMIRLARKNFCRENANLSFIQKDACRLKIY